MMSLLRPATFTERFFLMTNSHSFMNTGYALTVSARGPLENRHVHQAVAALTARVPVLRRGFEKDPISNEFWVKELDSKDVAIDYQVLDTFGNVEEELLKIASHKYDVSNGPLFQIRIFRCDNADLKASELNKDSCVGNSKRREDESTATRCNLTDPSHMENQPLSLNSIASADAITKAGSCFEEITRTNKNIIKRTKSEEFPYHYTILYGIFHGTADGYTNLRIISLFLTLLSDSIQDKISNIEKQFDHHEGFPYTDEIVQNGIKLLENQETLSSLKIYLNSAASASSKISRILKVETNKQVTIESRMIPYKFSVEETARIFALCKKESVTVNSFFTALINIAILDMCMDKINKSGSVLGNEQKLAISSDQTVDLRRYWSDETQTLNVLGPHIHMIQVCIDTKFSLLEDIKNTFWPYAKMVHEEIKSHTSPINLGMHVAYETMFPLKNLDDLVLLESDPRSVFSVTNIGDITKNLHREEDEDFISLIDVDRCVSIHQLSIMTLHFLHTFRGRLTHDIVYSTRYFDQMLTSRLHSKVLEIIKIL